MARAAITGEKSGDAFVGASARPDQAAMLLGCNRKSINRSERLLRSRSKRISWRSRHSCVGTVEVDESLFGTDEAERGGGQAQERARLAEEAGLRGLRARRAGLHRADRGRKKGNVAKGYTRSRRPRESGDQRRLAGLRRVGGCRQRRACAPQQALRPPACFADNGVHINGIESFWSYTKRRLAKYNGGRRNFELHLEAREWR